MKRVIFLIAPIAGALSLMITSCTKSLTAAAIAANMQVSTLAGIGTRGSTNGPNLTASFGSPYLQSFSHWKFIDQHLHNLT